MHLPSRAVTVPGTLAAPTSVALTSKVPRAMVVFLMRWRYMRLSSATIVFLSCFCAPPCLACRGQEGVSGFAAFAQREEQRLCHSCDVSTTGLFPCLHGNAKMNLSKRLE